MTKKPPVEEFVEKYKQYASRKEAVESLTDLYNASKSSVYEWIKQYVGGFISSVGENIEEKTEDFFDMLEDLDIEENQVYRSADITIPVDSGGILVALFADMHIGSKFTNMNQLREHVKLAAETDGVYVMVPGDLIDVAGVKSTPYKDLLHDQAISYKQDKALVKKLYETLHDKIIATTTGCHGAWSFADTGEYFEEELALLTNSKIFLQHGGVLNINLGSESYKIFVSHKLQGNSRINPTRAIFRLHEHGMDFDIGISAHDHKACISCEIRRGKMVGAVKCGSFKELDTFGNKSGFVPEPTTIPGFYLSADKHYFILFLDWREGLSLLC